MTETEWLVSTDSNRLICQMRGNSDRKLRLVAIGLCRLLWVRLSDSAREAVELADRIADGFSDEQRRIAIERQLRAAGGDNCRRIGKWLPTCAVSECGWYAAELGVGSDEFSVGVEAALVREIFGNPFRPVAVDPVWRTSTVLLLAQGIYEERAFDGMPILADALQDAGCDNDDILNHLRDPNATHVRGCWALDLILGKT